MKKIMVTVVFVAFCFGLVQASEPTRQSLLNAWELNLKNDPQISKFEKIDSTSYKFSSSYFPYQGKLRVLNAYVQEMRMNSKFNYMGIVEIELPDSSKEYFDKIRHSYTMWINSQNMYFNGKLNKWITTKEFQSEAMNKSNPFLYLLGGNVFWVILIFFIVFIWISTSKRLKESKLIINDSKNRSEKISQNSENISELSRQNHELNKEQLNLLKEILEELKSINRKTS